MNVFFLDEDPTICAEYHNDSHSSKMNIEYAQLMSTAHRYLDGHMWVGKTANGRSIKRYFMEDTYLNDNLYLACHINHPSAIWARHSRANYEWLYAMWQALGREYTHRYGRVHESQRKLTDILLLPPKNIDNRRFTQPPPAMSNFPECIVEGDAVQSYRNYYIKAKHSFSKWTNRDVPPWMVFPDAN